MARSQSQQQLGGWSIPDFDPDVSAWHQVILNRSQQAAQTLLGATFGGILTSDRHGGYNWVDLERRQLCWAHLKREFIKISERSGVSGQLGEALVLQQEKLFELWHRVRDGTLTRCEFMESVNPIREQVKVLLQLSSRLRNWFPGKDPSSSNRPHLSSTAQS